MRASRLTLPCRRRPEPTSARAASFDGDIGGIPTTAHASLDGDRARGRARRPGGLRGSACAPWCPRCVLQRPARAHVEAHGPLDALAVTAHLAAGRVDLDASGDVSVTGSPSVTMRIDVRPRRPERILAGRPRVGPHRVARPSRARRRRRGLLRGLRDRDRARRSSPGSRYPPRRCAATFSRTKQTIHVDAASSVVAFPADLGVGGHAAIQASATIALTDPASLEAHGARRARRSRRRRIPRGRGEARRARLGHPRGPPAERDARGDGLARRPLSTFRARPGRARGNPVARDVSASLLG